MQVGMIGLGRMGMNMARRLARAGHSVAAYNRSLVKAEQLAQEEPGVLAAQSLEHLAELLAPPRVVWTMLPAESVEDALERLEPILSRGDMVVEGGNSHYKDDPRRSQTLSARGIVYMDVGVSGGIWGLKEGYCLMVGGPNEGFARMEPILAALAAPEGYLHTGPVGSGHFLKMIHNGIEYGMMQAYAEGFDLLKSGPYSQHHDYEKICHLWMRGSVVRSWLLGLLEESFSRDPELKRIAGYVEDSGEGRWALMQALETATHAPVLALALMDRFRSRQSETFGDKVLAALRQQFGGHATKPA